jgi:TPR repeat protein
MHTAQSNRARVVLTPAQIERLLTPELPAPAYFTLPIVRRDAPAAARSSRRNASSIASVALAAVTLMAGAVAAWTAIDPPQRSFAASAKPGAAIAQAAEMTDTVSAPSVQLAAAPAAAAPVGRGTGRARDDSRRRAHHDGRLDQERPGSEPVAEEPAPVAFGSVPIDADMAASLIQRGDEYLLTGDIGSARLMYELAARADDPNAMMALAQTYDGGVLQKLGARGIRPNAEKAERWYRRAAAAQGGKRSRIY